MYTHRNFAHPGGVSPVKQEKMIDPNAGEGSGDAKVGRKKQSDIDYKKKQGEEFEQVATFAPVTGEIIDAKNTVKDLIAGDYGGAALNAAGFMIPFVPGSVIKKGGRAVMKYLRKTPGAEDAIKKGTKILDEGGSTGSKPKGGVDGGKNIIGGEEYYEGATHYGKIAGKDFNGVTNDIFEGVRQTGKVTDDALAKMNFNVATDLKPDHIKKIGNQGNRDIFEVAFPDGTTQKFWRSTGTGGKYVTLADGTKVSSEGFFGTVAGHMDAPPGVLGKPGSKSFKEGVDGWFIKGQGWEGYGSKTYKETGAVLKNFFDKGLIK